MSATETLQPAHPPGATVNADNPWPGLLSFRESDQEYFQGRKVETEELFRLVIRERLTALFGLSGLGKSSLLQAGLFPRLRNESVFPVYIRLDFSSAQPDLPAQIKSALGREAAEHHVEAPPVRSGETLWEHFHREGNTFWSPRNRPLTPLLVLDQFEEIFTLGRLDPDRTAATERLIEQLADLAEGRLPAALKAWIDEHPDDAGAFAFGRHHYKVLLSIREDFLPDLDALRARMPSVALHRLRLHRMNGEAALLVVNQARYLIDAEVAEQVVRFVAADRRNLPLAELEVDPALLSVVCRELNNRRLQLAEPKISSVLLEGAREQVLADFYDRSVGDLPPEVRCFIEDKLLTVSGYRDSVALENALSIRNITRGAIDLLVERRLVRREDRGGAQRLELTHDLLVGVVRESRDSRRKREEAEQDRVALLLAQEEERQKLQRTQEEEKRARDRRELKIFRIAAMVFLVLTLTAIGGGVWAVVAQRRASTASRAAEHYRDLQTQEALRAAQAAKLAKDRELMLSLQARAVLTEAKKKAEDNAETARRNAALAEKNAQEARDNAEKAVSETRRANELASTNVFLASVLKKEYLRLFNDAVIAADRRPEIEKNTSDIVQNRNRYEAVSARTNVPWYAIAVIHLLESSLRFDRHLHNGDPLTARTVHVPAGRPLAGEPPFAWEDSAADAIQDYIRGGWNDWSIPGLLIFWERTNGMAYRNRGVRSPYVWACTSLYTKGRFVADGRFDAEAVAPHCGGAAILKRLVELGIVTAQ